MRLIDADKLETHEQLEPLGNGKYEYVEVVYKDDIDNAHTIERREGKWMRLNDIDGFVRCSSCGTFWDHSIIETLHFHFCPYCGADMRWEQK